jgi:hypothetical protein
MLDSALRGPCAAPLRMLPDRAMDLLERLQAPPRLAAHLRLVHDVACQLAEWADGRYPELEYDRDAMLFGAATHDIGKIVFPAEPDFFSRDRHRASMPGRCCGPDRPRQARIVCVISHRLLAGSKMTGSEIIGESHPRSLPAR